MTDIRGVTSVTDVLGVPGSRRLGAISGLSGGRSGARAQRDHAAAILNRVWPYSTGAPSSTRTATIVPATSASIRSSASSPRRCTAPGPCRPCHGPRHSSASRGSACGRNVPTNGEVTRWSLSSTAPASVPAPAPVEDATGNPDAPAAGNGIACMAAAVWADRATAAHRQGEVLGIDDQLGEIVLGDDLGEAAGHRDERPGGLSSSALGFPRGAIASRSFHVAQGRVQSQVVALCTKAADLSDALGRGQRTVTKRLARVEVRQVDLDGRSETASIASRIATEVCV